MRVVSKALYLENIENICILWNVDCVICCAFYVDCCCFGFCFIYMQPLHG